MTKVAAGIVFLVFIALSNGVLANSILVVGDSLSAGYGMAKNKSWPSLLQNKLEEKGKDYKVHNASISGQTSAEGLRQMDQLLKLTKPELVVIGLGANDGLRGLSIPAMENNLQTMVSKSLMKGSKVLLLGIKLPNNYGRRYGSMFEKTFSNLSKKNGVPLVPFMLEPLLDVVTPENRGEYVLPDGLHPTPKAQPLILEHIWKSLGPLI